MSKIIDLGETYGPPPSAVIGIEAAPKPVKHYPSLSLPGCDCEDVPNTGTAAIKYRLRRIDRGALGAPEGGDGGAPRVDIEVMAIELPGGKGGAGPEKKKVPGYTADMLARSLRGTAADDGSPGSPSGGDADEDEAADPGEDGAEDG